MNTERFTNLLVDAALDAGVEILKAIKDDYRSNTLSRKPRRYKTRQKRKTRGER